MVLSSHSLDEADPWQAYEKGRRDPAHDNAAIPYSFIGVKDLLSIFNKQLTHLHTLQPSSGGCQGKYRDFQVCFPQSRGQGMKAQESSCHSESPE